MPFVVVLLLVLSTTPARAAEKAEDPIAGLLPGMGRSGAVTATPVRL